MRSHLIVTWLLLLLCGPVSAVLPPIPEPPVFDARSYLLMDYDSAAVLSEKDAHARVEPASITKIMTAYVVEKEIKAGNISLEDEVLVSEKAWRMQGSRMFIEVGQRVKVEALLKGLIIQSGNDASVALSEHVAGTEEAFVALMNAQAQALGLTETHYINSTGLPHSEHYTTARDIALLTAALIRDFPEQYRWYAERKYTYNGISQFNRNRLLWRDESVDGVKTGHTESAGYCLAASGKRGKMRLIAVVLGAESENARADHTQALLNYGFRFFETHRLYESGETLTQARVWMGEVEDVPLGLVEDLYVTIPRGQYDSLSAAMELPYRIEAPVEKGDVFGDVNIDLGGEQLKKVPLVALQSVATGGLVRQAVDTVLLWFQ